MHNVDDVSSVVPYDEIHYWLCIGDLCHILSFFYSPSHIFVMEVFLRQNKKKDSWRISRKQKSPEQLYILAQNGCL
jgi:hypothetical protein